MACQLPRLVSMSQKQKMPSPFPIAALEDVTMSPMVAAPAAPLRGCVSVPGDKSISHRALLLGASACGETRIEGLLEADDVLATAAAVRALGAQVDRVDGHWRIFGPGVGGFIEARRVLDMGNSGTGARLLMGLVASQPILSFFSGDTSLSGRPMGRVIEPLSLIGASVWARAGDKLPLAIRGATEPRPIEYLLPVASAQIKSAILLAGLNAPGRTSVMEPVPTRDHTERLLSHFGASVDVETLSNGSRRITVEGEPELSGRQVLVPGDISSAAFPMVAALTVPGSRVTLNGVGMNPLRTGLLDTLIEMGARITVLRSSDVGEPVADLLVEAGRLDAVDVPEARVASMIDEFPILAVAASVAHGTTRMRGLSELRVKESDRLAAIARGLTTCGVRVETGDDWLEIGGAGGPPPGGGLVRTHFDHRIAMAFLVLGLAARMPVRIDDGAAISTSFPTFAALMNSLGCTIGAPAEA
jgi:3-phosphoshikimate 1-carboxyvinyltransferase